MKKKWVWMLGASVAVLAVVLFVLGTMLGQAVRAAVVAFAPRLTGTEVRLESVSLSPLGGAGSAHGLWIGNPPGFTTEKAAYLGTAKLDVEVFSLLSDCVVIEEIVLRQPEFTYETKLIASNLGKILDHVRSATGGSGSTSSPDGSAKPLKFKVRRLVIEDGQIAVGTLGQAIAAPLPRIELTDLGEAEGGITADQLAGEILETVLGQVVRAAAGAATKAITEPGDTGRKVKDGIKGLLGN